MNVPLSVGIPLILIRLSDQTALTPAGNPMEGPMPVAPMVECVIFVISVLTQTVGVEDDTPAIFV